MTDLRKLLDEATKGPWIERWDEDGGAFVTGNGYTRAHMVGPLAERRLNARLIAMAPDLAAALLKAEEALEDISRQKKTDELETEYEAECADFEAGFDTCVDVARATLTEIRKFTGAA